MCFRSSLDTGQVGVVGGRAACAHKTQEQCRALNRLACAGTIAASPPLGVGCCRCATATAHCAHPHALLSAASGWHACCATCYWLLRMLLSPQHLTFD